MIMTNKVIMAKTKRVPVFFETVYSNSRH